MNFLLETLNKLLAHIPDFIWNIFNNWRISLLFLLVLAILCFRNIKIRTGAICFVLLFLFFVQLDRGGKLFYLFGAILLLIAGLFLMFSRYDKTSYYENILKRVRHSQTIGTEELRTILLVMEQMEHKKCMSDENFRQIVKDCYSADHLYSGNEINLISGELAKRMIHNYNLLSLRNDGDGIFLFPDPLLFSDDNLLRSIATTPRIIFVGFLALLWVLMPFDLIPDFMPFIGALDDITVLILSGTVIQNSSLPVSKRK